MGGEHLELALELAHEMRAVVVSNLDQSARDSNDDILERARCRPGVDTPTAVNAEVNVFTIVADCELGALINGVDVIDWHSPMRSSFVGRGGGPSLPRYARRFTANPRRGLPERLSTNLLMCSVATKVALVERRGRRNAG